MATSTNYDVNIRYKVIDKASKRIKNIERSTGSLARIASRAQMALGAFVGGRAAYNSLIKYNSQLQQARTTMAGMLMLNKGGTFQANMRDSTKLVENLRIAARKSVGTTEDFVNMASLVTRPLAQAGATMKEIEQVTVAATVAAKAFGIQAEMAALDIEQVLTKGVANRDRFAKAVLGPLLEAKKITFDMFNKMSGGARGKLLLEALNSPAIKAMADAQANTFEGRMSTLKDQLQTILGKIGLPLMERLTAEFGKITAWLDANPKKVAALTKSISDGLLAAFGMIKSVLEFLWNNRDLLLTIAKAFLVFKATKFASGAAAGALGALGNAFSLLGNKAKGASSGLGNLAQQLSGRSGLLGGIAALGFTIGQVVAKWTSSGKSQAEKDGEWLLGVGAKVFGDARMLARGQGSLATSRDISTPEVLQQLTESQSYASALGGRGLNAFRQQIDLASGTAIRAEHVGRFLSSTKGDSKYGKALVSQFRDLQDEMVNVGLASSKDLQKMSLEQFLVQVGNMEKLSNIQHQHNRDRIKSTLKANASLIQLVEGLSIAEKGPMGAAGKQEGLGPKKSFRPRVNVSMKVEVKSDDPDRFVIAAGKAFERAATSPSSAIEAFTEG